MKFTTSLFSQILQVMPRVSFMRLVHECGAERHAKGFYSWDQYVAMLFCQIAQAKSLREISDGLAVTCGKLSHLGLRGAPARSTLSYANAHRPWQLYQNAFFHLRDLCRSESPGKKKRFRFKNKLLSLDSTTIDLCLSLFPWADFRQTKGAVKLHLLLDHDGYLPDFAVITDGKTTMSLPHAISRFPSAASSLWTGATLTLSSSFNGLTPASSLLRDSKTTLLMKSYRTAPCPSAGASSPTSLSASSGPRPASSIQNCCAVW